MTTLPDDYRTRMFHRARELNLGLGDPFQNPVDLNQSDILSEIRRAQAIKQQIEFYMVDLNETLERITG